MHIIDQLSAAVKAMQNPTAVGLDTRYEYLPEGYAPLGENWLEDAARGVLRFAPTKMRMNILRRGDGITILDDAYNANPQSMRAALEVLSQTDATFRVAVLGDMFELGELGPELHRGMGECAAALGNIDALLAVGELAWNIYDAAHQAGMEGAIYAKDRAAAKPLLANFIRPGAVILVKASRGMAFEELTRELQRLAPKN